MQKIWSGTAAGILLVAPCVFGLAAPAQATGYGAEVWPTSAVRTETIDISSLDPCPGLSVIQTVEATVTDSASVVHQVGLVTETDPDADGYWSVGYLTIPANAALGAASIMLVCMDGATVTQTYDDIAITIVGNTTQFTISTQDFYETATIQSVVSCAAPQWVDVVIQSSEWYYNGYNDSGRVYSNFVVSGPSNIDGSWNFALDYDMITGLSVNNQYIVKVTCALLTDPSLVQKEYGAYAIQPGSFRYVALGDSYSSGEGTYSYDVDSGACHRSSDSYAGILADQLNVDEFYLRACSGAFTEDILYGTSSQLQLEYVEEFTDLVTLTVGGNDLGFAAVMLACTDYVGHTGWGCSSNTALASDLQDRLDALAGITPATNGGKDIYAIVDVLSLIQDSAPNAEIYIAGYPHLFGSSTADYTAEPSAPGNYKCGNLVQSVSYTDAQWMNGWADDLNQVIEDAVDDAVLSGVNVTYVSPSSFSGHGKCDSGTAWVNGAQLTIGLTPQVESYHPNDLGWQAYATAFEAAIS